MTNTSEEGDVAEAIAKYIYHSEGLETMAYSGEEDYAAREHHHYLRQASAAIAASNSKYIPQLVAALKQARIMATEAYLDQDGKSIIAASDFKDIELFLLDALNNLPEEVKQ